ncbi:MAG: zinc-binding dehydrogenase [Candidatus Krumholzibacteriia bacterium]
MALGAFSEYAVVPETMAIAIEGEIPAAHACLIGCAVMTGYGAATKTARVRRGETVAVIGCGGVGLAAVQGARLAGANRILAVDPIGTRREKALAVGASDAFAPGDAAGAVGAITEGGADVAIECVGRTETMQEAFAMVRPGGRAVVVGLPEFGDRLEIEPVLLLFEKSIKGSMYGSAEPLLDFPALVSLYDQGELDLGALVADTRPFAEINDAIAETRQCPAGRIVVTF